MSMSMFMCARHDSVGCAQGARGVAHGCRGAWAGCHMGVVALGCKRQAGQPAEPEEKALVRLRAGPFVGTGNKTRNEIN